MREDQFPGTDWMEEQTDLSTRARSLAVPAGEGGLQP